MNPSRRLRPIHFVLGVTGLAGLFLAIWLTIGPKPPALQPTEPAPSPQTPASADPMDAIVAEIPESLRQPLDARTDAVDKLAATLPQDPSQAAQALAKLREDGLLVARPFPGEAAFLPRSADQIAKAVLAKQTTPTSSFELTMLLGAILRSRGQTPEYAKVPKARFDATELLARRFAVRTTTPQPGPWLASDTMTAGSTEGAVRLTGPELVGYLLAHQAKGALALHDGDFASRAVGYARRLLPDDAAVLFVAAESEGENDLQDEARRTFDKAAALASDAMTAYRLGQNARNDQKPFKADEHMKRATQLDPTFAAPWVALAELALERLDVTPKDEHQGIRDAAKDFIDAAKKADPKAAGIRLVEAHLLSLDEKNDEARALLEEEVRLHPELAESFIMLANVQAAEHKDAEAIKTLEDARAHGHETEDVLDGLGTLYAATERFDDGQKIFERLLGLFPKNAQVRVQLAQFYRQAAQTPKARELLQAQLKSFPADATAALLLAQLELEAQHPGEAKALVDKILAADPTHREARLLDYLIGIVAEKPSEEARKKAIETVGSRRRLAEMLLQNGLIPAAETNLEDAITAEPEDLVAPVLLTTIYLVTEREPKGKALREATLAKVDAAQRAELQKLFEDALAQAMKAKQQEPMNP
jgi:Tfp pilus assembly protein PilF